jgi:hypothetical protein
LDTPQLAAEVSFMKKLNQHNSNKNEQRYNGVFHGLVICFIVVVILRDLIKFHFSVFFQCSYLVLTVTIILLETLVFSSKTSASYIEGFSSGAFLIWLTQVFSKEAEFVTIIVVDIALLVILMTKLMQIRTLKIQQIRKYKFGLKALGLGCCVAILYLIFLMFRQHYITHIVDECVDALLFYSMSLGLIHCCNDL